MFLQVLLRVQDLIMIILMLMGQTAIAGRLSLGELGLHLHHHLKMNLCGVLMVL